MMRRVAKGRSIRDDLRGKKERGHSGTRIHYADRRARSSEFGAQSRV